MYVDNLPGKSLTYSHSICLTNELVCGQTTGTGLDMFERDSVVCVFPFYVGLQDNVECGEMILMNIIFDIV